ncbi:MAG: WD40/YVTN/BNR-like repeat-containing protein, partial [Bacteroidota bacterium]
YVAHDGGLHVTADGGSSWSDLSAGIDVSEPWGASMSVALDRIRILCGTQDCGTVLYDADQDALKGEWLIVRGGDGMKPFVSRTNPDSMIAVDGNNNLNHYSSDGGRKWITSRPVTGSRAEYLRPFVPDPWKPETLYTGYQDLYRSANGGKDWLPLKVPGTGTVAAIAVAASDSKVIYVAYSGPAWSEKISGKLFRSQDGGTTWMDISGGLRGAAWTSISSIAVNPRNPRDVVVGFRGAWSVKAMRIQAGITDTWTDISHGLPVDADVNALIFDPLDFRNCIYAATHQGVFRFKTDEGGWSDFNGTMRPVLSVDLDIDPSGHWMCLATHGRGVWITRLD